MNGPLTEKIRQQILSDILRGRYAPGDRLPTERETAMQAGCSRVTVRRAFAQLQNAGIIERSPSRGTRVSRVFNGSRQPIGSIGIVASLKEDFSVEFIEALCRTCRTSDILTVLAPADDEPEKQPELAIRLVSSGILNLVIWGLDRRFDFSLFERLRVLGVNLVFFDRLLPGPWADFIGLDNRDAMEQLFRAAYADGLERALFIGRRDLEADAVNQRRRTLEECCRSHGIAFVTLDLPRFIDEAAAAEALHVVSRGTSLFTVNDETALQLAPFLPPEQKVYSIDGTRAALRAGITSCSQPLEEMAQAVLESLERQRRLGPRWRATIRLFPGRLHHSEQKTARRFFR